MLGGLAAKVDVLRKPITVDPWRALIRQGVCPEPKHQVRRRKRKRWL